MSERGRICDQDLVSKLTSYECQRMFSETGVQGTGEGKQVSKQTVRKTVSKEPEDACLMDVVDCPVMVV